MKDPPEQTGGNPGRIHVEVSSGPMRLVERDGFLAAEVDGDHGPALSVEEVRAALERVRR